MLSPGALRSTRLPKPLANVVAPVQRTAGYVCRARTCASSVRCGGAAKMSLSVVAPTMIEPLSGIRDGAVESCRSLSVVGCSPAAAELGRRGAPGWPIRRRAAGREAVVRTGRHRDALALHDRGENRPEQRVVLKRPVWETEEVAANLRADRDHRRRGLLLRRAEQGTGEIQRRRFVRGRHHEAVVGTWSEAEQVGQSRTGRFRSLLRVRERGHDRQREPDRGEQRLRTRAGLAERVDRAVLAGGVGRHQRHRREVEVALTVDHGGGRAEELDVAAARSGWVGGDRPDADRGDDLPSAGELAELAGDPVVGGRRVQRGGVPVALCVRPEGVVAGEPHRVVDRLGVRAGDSGRRGLWHRHVAGGATGHGPGGRGVGHARKVEQRDRGVAWIGTVEGEAVRAGWVKEF